MARPQCDTPLVFVGSLMLRLDLCTRVCLSVKSENWEEDNIGWELTHRSTFGNKSNTRWRPEYHFLGLVMNESTIPGHTRKRRFGRVGKN
jgi:hypothetical protein